MLPLPWVLQAGIHEATLFGCLYPAPAQEERSSSLWYVNGKRKSALVGVCGPSISYPLLPLLSGGAAWPHLSRVVRGSPERVASPPPHTHNFATSRTSDSWHWKTLGSRCVMLRNACSVVFYVHVLGINIFVIFKWQLRGPRKWKGPLWGGGALANPGLPYAFWWLVPQFPPLKLFYMTFCFNFWRHLQGGPLMWLFLTPSHSCVCSPDL